jgi:hypothetical protein
LGSSIDKDEIISQYTQVDDKQIGNSGRFGSNTYLNEKVGKNSLVEDKSLGNGGLASYNLSKDEKIDSNSKINNPEIGNSGLIGRNETLIERSAKSKSSTTSVGRNLGDSKKLDEIIDRQSEVENPNLANKALRGKNLNLGEFSKYSNSRLYGTVDWTNIQFPKSGQRFPPPTT